MRNMNLKIINLGCGNKKLSEEIDADIILGTCVDIVTNLNSYPLPFPDNSIDIVRSTHVFEHLDGLVALMENIHRSLKPNGLLEFTVPHVNNIEYFRDPTHKRPFISGTMDYFIRGIKPIEYTSVDFEYIDKTLIFGKGLRGKIAQLIYGFSLRKYEKYYCWKYPYNEISYTMRALKY